MLPIKIIPHLTREELEVRYKKEKNAHQLKRYQAILWAYDTNFYPNVKRIAKRLRVTERTVYNWINTWNKEGPDGLIIKKSSGHPPILNPEEQEEFIEDVLRHPREVGYDFSSWTLKAMAEHMKQKFGRSMSLSGIFRLLKRHNITLLVPRPLPAKGDEKKKRNSRPN